jgi:hypothetical protein
MKICRICQKELDEVLFPKTWNGNLSTRCKSCTADYKKQRKERLGITVSEADKRWKEVNRTRYLQSMHDCHARHKDEQEYKQKRANYNAAWYADNKDHAIQSSIEYARERKQRDPLFRLQGNLRSYLSRTLKTRGLTKNRHLMDLMACDWPTLEKHLESHFIGTMSWRNYGQWHVDHIQALANFDLNDPTQLAAAWNYKNLQPLWAHDNLKKSNRLNNQHYGL